MVTPRSWHEAAKRILEGEGGLPDPRVLRRAAAPWTQHLRARCRHGILQHPNADTTRVSRPYGLRCHSYSLEDCWCK